MDVSLNNILKFGLYEAYLNVNVLFALLKVLFASVHYEHDDDRRPTKG